MQIYADVLGLTLSIPRTTEASLLGSAVVAAAGAGAYDDLASASRGIVMIVEECRMSGRARAGGGADNGKR